MSTPRTATTSIVTSRCRPSSGSDWGRCRGCCAAHRAAFTGADDYEAVMAPLFAWIDAVAQQAPTNDTLNGQVTVRAWRALRPAAGRRTLSSRGARGGLPARRGCAQRRRPRAAARRHLRAGLRRAGLRAMGEVAERLGVGAGHVIFGHTHRGGPLPDDAPAEWAAPSGAAAGQHRLLVLRRLVRRGDRAARAPTGPAAASSSRTRARRRCAGCSTIAAARRSHPPATPHRRRPRLTPCPPRTRPRRRTGRRPRLTPSPPARPRDGATGAVPARRLRRADGRLDAEAGAETGGVAGHARADPQLEHVLAVRRGARRAGRRRGGRRRSRAR